MLRGRSGQQAYQALYRGESAAKQEPNPNKAFAAILSEPDLANPSTIAPRPNTKPPRPHDLKTSLRIGPPMSKIAANNRSIPVPDGFLVDISLLA
jgi:hypothetical protein